MIYVPAVGDREAQTVEMGMAALRGAVDDLRATPGCLGADQARFQGGKRSIFAMFKDKASAVAWYRSASHQGMLEYMGPHRAAGHEPLSRVPDDAGPILVVATMTPADAATGAPRGSVLLSVELFEPLEGGVRFGGSSFLPLE